MPIDFYGLSFSELMSSSIEKLKEADIVATPGGLVRAFLEMSNTSISRLSDRLVEFSREAFVSTATSSSSLNAIGGLFGISQLSGEPLETFRYRIVTAINQAARDNIIAIRVAALNVPGVSDVKIHSGFYGPATVAAFVEAQNGVIPTQSQLDLVYDSIAPRLAEGISLYVSRPEYLDVRVRAVVFVNSINPTLASNITNQIRDRIVQTEIGERLCLDDITAIFQWHVRIHKASFRVEEVLVNGKPVTYCIETKDNEKLIPDRFVDKAIDIRMRRYSE